MRLIDADDFFNRMNNDTALCAEMEFEGLKALKKYLDLQPTAYSVDKVVRQLNLESVSSSIQVSLGLLKAIKIVKAGVNNEN